MQQVCVNFAIYIDTNKNKGVYSYRMVNLASVLNNVCALWHNKTLYDTTNIHQTHFLEYMREFNQIKVKEWYDLLAFFFLHLELSQNERPSLLTLRSSNTAFCRWIQGKGELRSLITLLPRAFCPFKVRWMRILHTRN